MSKFSWRQFKFQIPPWCQENGIEEGNDHAEAESYVGKLEASVIDRKKKNRKEDDPILQSRLPTCTLFL